MRVLIFGAAGMLGTDLVASAPTGATVIAPGIDEVDITSRDQLSDTLDASRPHWVINAAAYTAVDRAESERDLADAANGVAPGLIGKHCARRGIAVAHFGTDYVFPGTATTPYHETDPVDPVNAYGQSKLQGERALLASGAHSLVLRTQWLFGRTGRSFPRTMLERATAGLPTRVVDDQHGRPTYTKDLAAATWQLIVKRATGIVHVTSGGPPATWFELAREVFLRAGAESLLTPCSTRDFPTPAKRPAYSVLSTDRLHTILGRTLPNWQEGLHRFLDELGAGRARRGSEILGQR